MAFVQPCQSICGSLPASEQIRRICRGWWLFHSPAGRAPTRLQPRPWFCGSCLP